LVFGALISYGIQIYFDLCCGCLLSMLEPKFTTYGDVVDMVHTYIGILFAVIFPIFVFFFLNKYENGINEEKFIKKYGSLYEG